MQVCLYKYGLWCQNSAICCPAGSLSKKAILIVAYYVVTIASFCKIRENGFVANAITLQYVEMFCIYWRKKQNSNQQIDKSGHQLDYPIVDQELTVADNRIAELYNNKKLVGAQFCL